MRAVGKFLAAVALCAGVAQGDVVIDTVPIGKPMRVIQITAAVLKAGYSTKNKALAKSVGVALREMLGVKKVGRGTLRAT